MRVQKILIVAGIITAQDAAQRSAIFQNAASNWLDQIAITCLHTTDNITGHWARMFKITT